MADSGITNFSPSPKRHIRCCLLFGALFILVALVISLCLDHFILDSVNGGNLGHLPGDVRRTLQSLKEFGQLVAIFVAFLLIFILDKPRRRMLPKLLLCVLLPSVLVWPTKLGVHRLRPHCTDEYSTTLGLGFFLGREPQKPNPALPLAVQGKIEADHKLDSSDIASFPSAHTATAFAFAVGLSALYPSARVVFYALAAGCGCQRIIFGAHWFSDVVAGLLIGLLTARVVWLWPDKTIGELFGKIWSRSRDSQRQNNQDLQ